MVFNELKVGDLVTSTMDAFEGIGKIYEVVDEDSVIVSFFSSPLKPHSRRIELPVSILEKAKLHDERVVFCKNPSTNYWQRARYGGERPGKEHLLIFRRDDMIVVDTAEVFVPNLPRKSFHDPFDYLKSRCTDSPFFSDARLSFYRSYIEQRAGCRSIGAITSSSIELETHQIAVVRRVLLDEKKKYLLADEVGLGKTVEACLIIKEILFESRMRASCVIGVPHSLEEQWKDELDNRFHLGRLIDEKIFVVSHQNLANVVEKIKPEILVIDEVHQISKWAWSNNDEELSYYQIISEACGKSDVNLLLSGTPLVGNELNFLATLHFLSPEEYLLTREGIESFKLKVKERERLGGIYQAIIPENDDISIESSLDQLKEILEQEEDLIDLVNATYKYVDFFADVDADDRKRAIQSLRRYIGENYRLHQRLLRNRRDDPGIENLFPGLDGVTIFNYESGNQSFTVEQYLEEFRATRERNNWSSFLITEKSFQSWINLSFMSPSLIAREIRNSIDKCNELICPDEEELLHDILEAAEIEQTSKDRKLTEVCRKILEDDSKTKIVVFCGEISVADCVFEHLNQNLDTFVERHDVNEDIGFNLDPAIRILVCDHRGEDGLNLNGGRKVALHYSLPMSLPRIEQRLGRLNRYSASIHALPVKNVVLIPNHGVYSQIWMNILDKSLGIFHRSLASLQHVLENAVSNSWLNLAQNGPSELQALSDELTGQNGLVQTEYRRVRAQEELNRLEADIENANDFAEEVEESDERAEKNINAMSDWIERVLQFEKKIESSPEIFRYKYQIGDNRGPQTLMDLDSFIRYCYPSLDTVKSQSGEPQTVEMSADRQAASLGRQVHPMRYGSPFIDVIYDHLSSDPRGVCSAWIRYTDNPKLTEPTPFLGISVLVSLTGVKSNDASNRIADEIFPPRIIEVWVDSDGLKAKPEFVSTLEKKYQKDFVGGYRDLNIRSELWNEIEDYAPEWKWTESIEKMAQHIRQHVLEKLPEINFNSELHIDVIALRYVLMVGSH